MNSETKNTDWSDCAGRASIAAALRYGSILSTAVMSLGLMLAFIRGGAEVGAHEIRLALLLRKSIELDPVAVTELGILLLLLTPALRVIIAMVGFAWERDVKYSLISLGVLLILAAGMAAALF